MTFQYKKVLKKQEDMTLEQRVKLEILFKQHPEIAFDSSNEATSWGDFNRFPTTYKNRHHLIVSGEICIIDREWQGRHAYVACKFYGNGDKVKDLFPIAYVDELGHREWRNGYFLIPDLRDGKPVEGWEPDIEYTYDA